MESKTVTKRKKGCRNEKRNHVRFVTLFKSTKEKGTHWSEAQCVTTSKERGKKGGWKKKAGSKKSREKYRFWQQTKLRTQLNV
eukprot:1149764-Pelagomonas_calceolata.AAC.2